MPLPPTVYTSGPAAAANAALSLSMYGSIEVRSTLVGALAAFHSATRLFSTSDVGWPQRLQYSSVTLGRALGASAAGVACCAAPQAASRPVAPAKATELRTVRRVGLMVLSFSGARALGLGTTRTSWHAGAGRRCG